LFKPPLNPLSMAMSGQQRGKAANKSDEAVCFKEACLWR